MSQLFEHGRNVNNNTVSEHVYAFRVKDTAWKEMESILVAIGNDGMAGVRSTIESCADLIVLGEDVDKLALALIAPLGSENDREL